MEKIKFSEELPEGGGQQGGEVTSDDIKGGEVPKESQEEEKTYPFRGMTFKIPKTPEAPDAKKKTEE